MEYYHTMWHFAKFSLNICGTARRRHGISNEKIKKLYGCLTRTTEHDDPALKRRAPFCTPTERNSPGYCGIFTCEREKSKTLYLFEIQGFTAFADF
jgi:hypothetical protein